MYQVTVGDLKDHIGMKGPRPVLYCSICHQESSAHKGDYFMLSNDFVFKCCDEPMWLVRKEVVYYKLDPKEY